MEISDYIALTLGGLGFLISIVGYVITPFINLRSKRLEKKLENRAELFLKIVDLWDWSHSNSNDSESFIRILREINKRVQLYGYRHEHKLFNELVDSYNGYVSNRNDSNHAAFIEKSNEFLSYSMNKYRRELCLDKLP